MSNWTRRRFSLLCALFGATTAAAALFVGAASIRRESGPRVKVSPGRLELAVGADGAKPRGGFLLENVGGADLVLGPPATTCTCTVVSIEPKTVPPGGKAVLTVEGRPPGAGRSRVFVRVPVNTQPGTLELPVDLVGRAVPPYVAYYLTSIRFGVVGEAGSSERTFVETREAADSPHWLLDPRPDSESLEVRGGFVSENTMGNGVVRRRYEYDVRLVSLPGEGEFQGEVRFRGRDGGDAPVLVMPVHAIVVPPEDSRSDSLGAGSLNVMTP